MLSLDNYKCWKSNVGAWIRGDGKPYHIKAALAGVLSTKEYFFKVFLQNHFWTYAWFRFVYFAKNSISLRRNLSIGQYSILKTFLILKLFESLYNINKFKKKKHNNIFIFGGKTVIQK